MLLWAGDGRIYHLVRDMRHVRASGLLPDGDGVRAARRCRRHRGDRTQWLFGGGHRDRDARGTGAGRLHGRGLGRRRWSHDLCSERLYHDGRRQRRRRPVADRGVHGTGAAEELRPTPRREEPRLRTGRRRCRPLLGHLRRRCAGHAPRLRRPLHAGAGRSRSVRAGGSPRGVDVRAPGIGRRGLLGPQLRGADRYRAPHGRRRARS